MGWRRRSCVGRSASCQYCRGANCCANCRHQLEEEEGQLQEELQEETVLQEEIKGLLLRAVGKLSFFDTSSREDPVLLEIFLFVLATDSRSCCITSTNPFQQRWCMPPGVMRCQRATKYY